MDSAWQKAMWHREYTQYMALHVYGHGHARAREEWRFRQKAAWLTVAPLEAREALTK